MFARWDVTFFIPPEKEIFKKIMQCLLSSSIKSANSKLTPVYFGIFY